MANGRWHPDECECFGCKARSLSFTGYKVRADHRSFRRDREKENERELQAYRDAVKEGIQPDGTQMHQIEQAKAISDELGVAYRGDDRLQTARDAGMDVEVAEYNETEKAALRGSS